MDELINTFLDTYINEDLQEDITKSFDLFDFFEYKQAYSGFVDILTNQTNLSSDDLKDQFIAELHSKLDFILKQHTIELIDTATINQKNDILTSLAHLQRLEDYTGVIRLLESFTDDAEILATIISDSTTMEYLEVMTLIKSFNPSMLKTLKEYIYNKESNSSQSGETNINLVDNIKIFCAYSPEKTLGAFMLENGVLLGDRFSTYYQYVQDDISIGLDHSKTALDILSIIYLSIDGYNSPLLIYRKYSFQILKDLSIVSSVEVQLLNHIAKFSEYKKVLNEKNRLSTASIET